MKLTQCIKPISYLKANAAAIIRDFNKGIVDTVGITQNDEAKAVLMNIKTFDEIQETITMLKLVVQSNLSLQQGKVN